MALPTGVLRQLPVTLRFVRCSVVIMATGSAAVVVWRAHLAGDIAELVLAVGLAIGLSPILDDPAAITLASSPTSRMHRVLARFAIVVPLGVAWWVITRGLAMTASMGPMAVQFGRSVWVPSRESWLVVAALSALAIAVEARGSATGSSAGIGGSVCVLVFVGVATQLPGRWTLLPLADHPAGWLGVLGLASVAAGLAMGDPGRPHIRLTRRPNRFGCRSRQPVGGS